MFPACFHHPPSRAAIMTLWTNPALLCIQTFYKMYIYIYIFMYPCFKYRPVCSWICFECSGSVRSIWRLYAALSRLKSKPRIYVLKHHHREEKSFLLNLLLFRKSKETLLSPSDSIQICIFPFLCFNLTNSTSGFSSSNCYWILMHASLNDIFFRQLAVVPALMGFLFFLIFAFWGWP